MDNEIETASDEFIEEEDKDEEDSKPFTVQGENDTKREIEDERSDCTRTKIKIAIQMGNEALRKPLSLSNRYPTESAELYMEMLPKIVFDMVDEEAGEEIQEPIIRRTFDRGIQVEVPHADGEMQTLTNKLLNAWTQYEPRLCTEEERSSFMHFAMIKGFLTKGEKRIERTLTENVIADNFFFDINSLCPEDCDAQEDKTSLVENMSFACSLQYDSKMISSLDWHSLFPEVFVAATMQTCKFEEKMETLSRFILEPCKYYVWCIEDQTMPRLLLESFEELRIIKFSPTLPHLVAGGGMHGQICLWDIAKFNKTYTKQNMFESQPAMSAESALSGMKDSYTSTVLSSCASSSIHYNHLNGLYCLEWIPPHFEVKSKGRIEYKTTDTSYQLITGGFDSTLRFWDLRGDPEHKADLINSNQYHHLDDVWKPFHSIELIGNEKKHMCIFSFALRAYGGIKDAEKQKGEKIIKENIEESDLEEQSSQENISCSEFCAGTEEGEVFCGYFDLSKDKTGKFVVKPLKFYTSLHGVSVHGECIRKLAYSPFMDDIFFSIGGHTIAIWKSGMQRGPLFLKVCDESVTTGLWSETKPAVFITGSSDGSIAIWNILQNSRQPIHMQAVTTAAIEVISIQILSETEQILAVGDYNGITHILTFSSVLWNPIENELNLTREFFDREAERATMEIDRLDVAEAKRVAEAKMLEETAKKKKDMSKAAEKVLVDDEEKRLTSMYESFMALQEEQMKELGYWDQQEEVEEDVE